MIDGGNQPGIAILKAVRVFSPVKVNLLNLSDRSVYDDTIPGFQEVTNHELKQYVELAGREIAQTSNALEDTRNYIHLFWLNHTATLPKLAKLYYIYNNASCSSADTERSFSKLKKLLRADRQNLTTENVAKLAFLG